ncbi:RAVE protein 1 C terminal-domain-containing protein [Melampsora americana]|nr:RAVE protein 1 C terminal-domain-containing protein [Melampsora americana]
MDAVRQSTCPLVLSAINPSRGALCLTSPVASEDPCLIYASGLKINVFDVPLFNLRQVIDLSTHLPQSWLPSLHGVEAVCATESKLVVASGPYVVVFARSKSQSSKAIWNLHSSFTSGVKRITSIILKGNDCLLIAEDGVSLYQAFEPAEEGGFVTIPRWIGKWATHAESCTDADFFRSSDGRCHIASYVVNRPILHFYSSRTSDALADIYEMSYRRLSLSSSIRSISFDQLSTIESGETNKTLYVSLHNRFAGVHTHIYNLEFVLDDEAPSNFTIQGDLPSQSTILHPSHQGVINCPASRSHRVIQAFCINSKHIPTLYDQEKPLSRCLILSILSNGNIHVSREPSLIRPPSPRPELYQLPLEMIQLLADPNVMIHGTTRTKNVDHAHTATFFIIFARSASSASQLRWHEIPLGTFTSGLLCSESALIDSALTQEIPHGLSVIPTSDGASDILVATSSQTVSNPVTFHWWKLQYRNNAPVMLSLADSSFNICDLRADAPIDKALTSDVLHIPPIADNAICRVEFSTQWWVQLSLSRAQTEAPLRIRLVAPKSLSPTPFVSEFALTGLKSDERVERYASAVKKSPTRASTSYWYLESLTSLNRLLVWELPAPSANTEPVHHEPRVALTLPSLIADLESQIRISSVTSQSYRLILAAGNDGNILQFKQSYDRRGESGYDMGDQKEWSRLVSVRHILGSSADTCTLLNCETKSSFVALLYFISSSSTRKYLKLILIDLRERSFGSGIVCAEEISIDPENDRPADTYLRWSADTIELDSEMCNSKLPSLAVAYGGIIKVYSGGSDGWWKCSADVRPKDGSAHVVSWITVNGQRSLIYKVDGHLYISSSIQDSRHPQMPYWHPVQLKNHLDFGDFESVFEVINSLATALNGNPQALSSFNSPNLPSNRDINLIANGFSKQDPKVSLILQESLDIIVRLAGESRIPSLTLEEQRALADLTLQLFTIQRSFSGIDGLGRRYLFSLVQHLSGSNHSQTDVGYGKSQDPGVLLAYHSSCQALLATQVIENVTKYALLSNSPINCTLNWKLARKVGLFLWLKPHDTILSTLELVAQQEYQSIPESSQNNVTREVTRDPAACSVFYMALRKKRLLLGLWRVAYGHPDRPHMLKFLANDFDEPRWKTAAQKNAFALISRQRFRIAIARAYEGDNGPVLRSLLRETVIPQGFLDGNRWILSWAFDMLDEKDLASRSPLDNIARTNIPKPILSDSIREQPGPLSIALVIIFNTIRNQDQVPSTDSIKENELAILTIKRLLKAGCTQLAYCVARTWRFQSRPRTTSQITSDKAPHGSTASKLEKKSSGDAVHNTITIDQDTQLSNLEAPPKTRVLKQVVVPEFDLSNF